MNNNEKVRLQKFFSDAHIMSRRAAEAEIEKGNIAVNGLRAVLGDKVDPTCDKVTWNGKVIKPNHESYTYLMLNKPVGFVTTLSDEKGRKCITDLISDAPVRVYPVGRLDMYSEGLILLTDDGELTNRLTHPSHGVSKKYILRIMGSSDNDTIKELMGVREIDGYRLQPFEVSVISKSNFDSQGREFSELSFVLYEGRNREIRKICEACDKRVISLKRVQIGEIKLGSLKTGKWRRLTKSEIDYLKGI